MKAFLGWSWFCAVQLIMFIALVFGLFILIYPCRKQLWVLDAKSIKDGRPIDRWKWPINGVYGNPEDGVSGLTALVMLNPVQTQPFMPNASPAWRAYCWSALRNSSDNLKYVFAWKGGPYAEFQLWGKTRRLGWYPESGIKVPVL